MNEVRRLKLINRLSNFTIMAIVCRFLTLGINGFKLFQAFDKTPYEESLLGGIFGTGTSTDSDLQAASELMRQTYEYQHSINAIILLIIFMVISIIAIVIGFKIRQRIKAEIFDQEVMQLILLGMALTMGMYLLDMINNFFLPFIEVNVFTWVGFALRLGLVALFYYFFGLRPCKALIEAKAENQAYLAELKDQKSSNTTNRQTIATDNEVMPAREGEVRDNGGEIPLVETDDPALAKPLASTKTTSETPGLASGEKPAKKHSAKAIVDKIKAEIDQKAKE